MSSRESDSAHPSPRRTGPDAYPSGTPPYGTGIPGGFGADPFGTPPGQPAAARPGEADGDDVPKTETTLTTRVRINIPGSRPIPPVVMRSTVKSGEAAAPAEPAGPRHRSAAASSPVLGVVDATAPTSTPANLPPEWQEAPAAPAESDPTGEWFKPRQKAPQAPVAAGAPRAEAGAQQPQAPQPGPRSGHQGMPAGPVPSGAPASPFAPGGPPPVGGGRPDDPFADRRPQAPFANDPYAADPYAADPFREEPARQAPPAADPFAARHPGEPEDTQIGGFDPIQDDFDDHGGRPGAISGSAALFGSAPPAPADPFAPNPQGAPQDPFAASRPAAPGRFAEGPYEPAEPFPGSRPTGPRQAADPFGAARPAPAAGSEPAGETAAGPAGPVANGPARTPVRPGRGQQEPDPFDTESEPAEESAAKAPVRRGKGRKLATYGVVLVLFAGAAAYGTGLMLNQADIPKGTTVLGTDIGGDTRDQAVSALDGTVAKTGRQPLKLKLGDQTVDLDPIAAGLSFDTTATVDGLTRHSYNPVQVIGSLTGGSNAVSPEVRVDRAKLKAALEGLGAKSTQGLQEGFVRFTPDGKAEVVPGKAGQQVDAAAALDQVEQAFRARATGQPDAVLTVPVTAAQPKVSEDALKAAAESLGKQVTNGPVSVTAGTKRWDFTRAIAAKVLTLAPDASGKVVLTWDIEKLTAELDGAFSKSKTKKGTAQVPITPQDVADGIASVLDKTGTRAYKFA
ncbi:peptidoglycan binding domain-containing protein [Kitasatospora sp. NPDC002040]|uniref:peptidoglycan binding domain-containing protein n=1 Tax=Kitasatospora sp. NPDC002040 TaxID=3154661 RepID=UPI00331ABC3B